MFFNKFPLIFIVLSQILISSVLASPFIYYDCSIKTRDNYQNKVDSVCAKDSVKNFSQNSASRFTLVFTDKNNPPFFSYTINKEEYDFDNFRFFGDVFKQHFPAFINDFGTFGQPHELLFYGLGSDNISATYGNLTFEEAYYGTIDFNRFQINSISQVTLHHLPKGFLYGDISRSVNILFIPVEEYSKVAHTRIFYFQGANEEAMINIYFHKALSKKILLTFDLANAMISPEYKNSDYDTWNGSARLNYLPDSTMNFTLLFSRYRAITHLNGGVDLDSLKSEYGNNYNDILYNGFLAPVLFSKRYLKTEWNNYVFLAKKQFGKNNTIKFSSSYADYYTRLNYPSYILNNVYPEHNVFTFSNLLTHKYSNSNFFTEENLGFTNSNLLKDNSFTDLRFSFQTGFNFFKGKFLPSIFARYDKINSKSNYGLGCEINLGISNTLKFYAGYSLVNKNTSPLEFDFYFPIKNFPTQKIISFETGIHYSTDFIKANLSLYNYQNDNSIFYFFGNNSNYKYGFTKRKIFGVHLYSKFRIAFLTATINYNYLFNRLHDLQISPRHSLTAGLFYTRKLFDNNLLMKTGINFYFNGKQNFFYRDFFTGRNFWFEENNNSTIEPINKDGSPNSFTFDFFFAGRIQERATVYFIFENLLDNKYFIVPFYPKQPRGIRIGVSWDLFN